MNNEEIKNQLDTTLDELGWAELGENERQEIKTKILDSFDRIILETTLMTISEDQASELQSLIQNNEENVEDVVVEFASQIPGLSNNIDLAVRNEWERWKEILKRN